MTAPAFPPRCAKKFDPVRLLASGGFGHVWLAQQRGLQRPAAVKLLNAGALEDASAGQRFLDEARVTATLSHPSIVRVLDHDVEDGIPWIAYEYLPGDTLRARLARRRMTLAEALPVALQLAGALEVVHAARILHRDVKPENVIEAEAGQWKLTDFGIAKWLASRVRTETGVIVGTPAYLAPELVAGATPAPAADLYALGCVLYEILAGTPPFTQEKLVDLLRAHADQQPAPLAEVVPGIPRALASLVEDLLAKQPAQRPASATEVRERLEGVPVTMTPDRRRDTDRTVRLPRLAPTTAKVGLPADPARTRGPLVWVATIAGALALAGFLAVRPPARPVASVSPSVVAPASIAASPAAARPAVAEPRGAKIILGRIATAARAHYQDLHDQKQEADVASYKRLTAALLEDIFRLENLLSLPGELTEEQCAAAVPLHRLVTALPHGVWSIPARKRLDDQIERWQGWFLPYVLRAGLLRAERSRQEIEILMREVSLRETALGSFEAAFMRGTPSEPVWHAWIAQVEWLTGALEKGDKLSLFGPWAAKLALMARLGAPRSGDAAEKRRRVFGRIAKNHGAEVKAADVGDMPELPARAEFIATGAQLDLELADWKKSPEHRQSALTNRGRQALGWCRDRTRQPGPPVPVPERVAALALETLGDNLDQISDMADPAQFMDLTASDRSLTRKCLAQYLLALDDLDALSDMVFEPGTPVSPRVQPVAQLRSLLANGKPGLPAVTAMMLPLVEAWVARHPRSWMPRTLLAAVHEPRLEDPGRTQRMARCMRAALELYESEEPRQPLDEFYRGWSVLVSHAILALPKNAKKDGLAELEQRVRRVHALLPDARSPEGLRLLRFVLGQIGGDRK